MPYARTFRGPSSLVELAGGATGGPDETRSYDDTWAHLRAQQE